MHLLDTAIVVALRAAHDPATDPGLALWATRAARHSLFISALTLHELDGHAALVAKRDRQAGIDWQHWVGDRVLRAFDGRILPVDVAVVRRAATLDYADRRDGLLAATALEHGLVLATFRPRAFRSGRIKLFDPTGYSPEPAVEDWRQAARAGPAWVKNLFVRS